MPAYKYSSETVFDGHLKVNSCGKQWLSDRDYETVRERGRIDYSLYFISEGMGYYEHNGTTYNIPEGSIVLYPPNVPQRYFYRAEDNTVAMWAHFSGSCCEVLDIRDTDAPVVIGIYDRKQFSSTFEKMAMAFYKKNDFSDMLCAGYMSVLLALTAQSRIARPESNSKVSNENLEKVLSHIHEHYSEAIDIDRYAGICCVSKDHFIRIFKAYTGLPPYNYQLKIRISRAIEMLENTSISVKECAELTGFSDNAYFSKIFKRFTGHPPSYYKK